MSKINWTDLFPTKCTVIIFVSYVLLFVSHGLLVISTQNSSKKYDYNVASLVFITEVLKLIFSVLLYWKEYKISTLFNDIASNLKLFALYFIPSFLYCIYNILSFVNLTNFDLTTYSLLMNFRVVVTGTIYQILFKRLLSRTQWISLIVLTLGCMMNQFRFEDASNNLSEHKHSINFDISSAMFLVLLQLMCSCFAGVYCEFLLKQEADVNIYVQNIFMYLDSMICNTFVIFFQGEAQNVFNKQNLSFIFHATVLALILNTAVAGIVTSFFLQSLNSIIKTFASALELVVTAILNFILFGVPIHLNTIFSIVMVCFSIILYAKNPVVSKTTKEKPDVPV